jgi:hypothetical protein
MDSVTTKSVLTHVQVSIFTFLSSCSAHDFSYQADLDCLVGRNNKRSFSTIEEVQKEQHSEDLMHLISYVIKTSKSWL